MSDLTEGSSALAGVSLLFALFQRLDNGLG